MFIRTAIIASLLASLATSTAYAADCPGYEGVLLCGDPTGDCSINASDALAALQMAVGLIPGVPEADVNNSGVVTAVDALEILNVAVGIGQETTTCNDPVVLTLTPLASGFYSQTGFHQPGNYAVGWYGVPNDDELRDYFVFNLPAIAGTATSAVLRLSTAPPGFIVYGSDDPSETFELFDVETPTGALSSGDGGIPAFADLAAGAVYGELVATPDLEDIVDVPFNEAGLARLAAEAGVFAVGGAITTLAYGAPNEFLFNSTSAGLTRQLILTIE